MCDLFHRFGVGKRSMEDKILEEADYLNEELRKQNGKPIDIAVSFLYKIDLNFLN